MQLASISLIDSADLGTGMILLHLLTFDRGWIAPRSSPGHTLVFYDGGCGLCHRTVRFLLAEDAAGLRFRFAPLGSECFRSARSASRSGFGADDSIPDSVLVQRPGEAMLTRAEGVIEIGRQLGGFWRLLASITSWVPISALNAGYDFIASIRHRLFRRPSEACPLLPPQLRSRFHG
jgi:predicted DCC family thiol-disulfide oxidoreductase YuxK